MQGHDPGTRPEDFFSMAFPHQALLQEYLAWANNAEGRASSGCHTSQNIHHQKAVSNLVSSVLLWTTWTWTFSDNVFQEVCGGPFFPHHCSLIDVAQASYLFTVASRLLYSLSSLTRPAFCHRFSACFCQTAVEAISSRAMVASRILDFGRWEHSKRES